MAIDATYIREKEKDKEHLLISFDHSFGGKKGLFMMKEGGEITLKDVL